MAALGIEAEVLDSGCCGLAGNFGFEKGHYDGVDGLRRAVLLPAVRAADPDVAVLADGFSCRTQLRQAGTREPVHLATSRPGPSGCPRCPVPGPARSADQGLTARAARVQLMSHHPPTSDRAVKGGAPRTRGWRPAGT